MGFGSSVRGFAILKKTGLALLAALMLGAVWAQDVDKRYEILGDGSTVRDRQTKLVWQRCSVGQTWANGECQGEAQEFTFDAAQELAGKGWRVPTIRELLSLRYCSTGFEGKQDLYDGGSAVDFWCAGDSYQKPTIQQTVFPNTPKIWFWSSTPYQKDASDAWGVGFNYGSVGYYPRVSRYRVRLVRASQ